MPNPNKDLHLRLPPELHHLLTQLAEKDHRSMNSMAKKILVEGIRAAANLKALGKKAP